MDEQHHLRRLLFVHSEELHQHIHDKIHGCVIIVQEYHPIPGRAFQGWFLGRYTDAVFATGFILTVMVP